MASLKSRLRREADLLLHRGTRATQGDYSVRRASRPVAVQRLIGALGNIMLSDSTPMMEKFVAGKVFHRLQEPGAVANKPVTVMPLASQMQFALRHLSQKGPSFAEVAAAIGDLAKSLEWVASKTGPFASLNIEHTHAHAVVAGASGVEERDDVALGLTIMAPYTRFPDHIQYRSRVFLALSDCEFSCDDKGWQRGSVGSIFFNDAGHNVAMRCTARPLLAAWCHVER
ncbi:dimethylsulfonioproprionate lyase family protein [Rhizobium sp. Root708]|uniref:dimethylsulfonioproprionate lyase family protein n=1 Tax=Rhizobium sp. Root708 TaxID=1736592 RepID=UPI000A5E2D5B|nr:dimethylsulfonioproprionate lyase family protein [Rhizobium sp. Root708]